MRALLWKSTRGRSFYQTPWNRVNPSWVPYFVHKFKFRFLFKVLSIFSQCPRAHSYCTPTLRYVDVGHFWCLVDIWLLGHHLLLQCDKSFLENCISGPQNIFSSIPCLFEQPKVHPRVNKRSSILHTCQELLTYYFFSSGLLNFRKMFNDLI